MRHRRGHGGVSIVVAPAEVRSDAAAHVVVMQYFCRRAAIHATSSALLLLLLCGHWVAGLRHTFDDVWFTSVFLFIVGPSAALFRFRFRARLATGCIAVLMCEHVVAVSFRPSPLRRQICVRYIATSMVTASIVWEVTAFLASSYSCYVHERRDRTE